jgi:hypothetical protein
MAGMLLTTAPNAHAEILRPGELVPLQGTTLVARPELAGTVVEEVLRPFSIDFGGGRTATGTIQDRVVRETAGTLDFYYRVFNDSTSEGAINFVVRNLQVNPWAFSTDVDFRLDEPGDIGAESASRNALGSPGGDQIFVNFLDTSIEPGESSRFFFMKTNATSYDENAGAEIAGITSNGVQNGVNFLTFQPIPEPATIWLLGWASAGLAAMTCRKIRIPRWCRSPARNIEAMRGKTVSIRRILN